MRGSPPARTSERTPFHRAALAAWIGSALEYYDFFIYGTAAALVFGTVFFPSSDKAAGTLLSLATFGVGYAARPIGAIVLGHFGDRLGRRKVLLATVLLMGSATFLVGCLPSYASIGVWAPILLVTLRLLQGFSAGGEQAGANSLTLEHAPEGRRAFFTSFTLSGTQGGQAIATGVFLAVATLSDRDLHHVGLAGAVLGERNRDGGRIRDPTHARRDAGVRGGEGGRRRRARAARRLVARPLARRSPRRVRGIDRNAEHDLHRVRPLLRSGHGRAGQDPAAVGRRAGQRRSPRHDPVVGRPVRPGWSQVGIPFRLGRFGRMPHSDTCGRCRRGTTR